MIVSFACNDTRKLFNNEYVKRFSSILKQGQIKLKLLHAAETLNDLRLPPGNRLEALKGQRKMQHSIRINNRWRICFEWHDDDAYNVEIVDYH